MSQQKIVRLEEVVKDYLKCNQIITSYEATNLTAMGENYGSQMLALKFHVSNGEQKEIIEAVAKIPPPGEFIQRMFNIPVTFRNEIDFYKKIIPELKSFLQQKGIDNYLDCYPKFIGGRLSLTPEKDCADEGALLILENLKYSGYETLDRIIGFDLETTNLILKALAKFHAGPLAMKLLNSQVFKTKIRSLFTPYKVFEFDEDTLSLCVEKNRKIVEEIGTCKKYIQRVVDGFKMNLQPVKNSPDCIREPFATIIHTDAWVNNFMVQFHEGKPVSCKIVDFQLDEYGSPARDLIFFIFTSVQIPVVLQHYEELIGLYHKTLVDDLVKFGCDPAPFSRQEFEEEINVMAKEEFGHCMMMLQPIFATKDTLKELDEYDVDDMTRVDTISPKYKERAAFIIEEFVKRDWI